MLVIWLYVYAVISIVLKGFRFIVNITIVVSLLFQTLPLYLLQQRKLNMI